MTTVYVATDRKHERTVAIKVLREELAAALGTERFLREIGIAARLSHPNILPLYDSGEVDGVLFYVMPFVEGESLRDRLERERQLSIDAALQIAREVADALSHAHSQGVIHRDIKPENILLSGGHAVVTDFGIAKALGDAGGERLTATGIAVGTPAYMSPEQAMGETVIDGRSDLYSLGCVLYEMLAGMPPFTGPTLQAILARRLTDPLPSLRAVRDTVPRAVEHTVRKLLARVPADRFGTAHQFVEALTAGPGVEVAGPTEDAVVIFDFENLSADSTIEWLSSGIAETVTVDLKKVAGIRVISRQSVARALSGQSLDGEQAALDLGRRLGARWVVWGSFQKAGDRLRITPQFLEVESGELAAAVKLDGGMSDVFDLQDRIVTSLLDVLDVQPTTREHKKIVKPETTQLKAYECYAKGRQLFNQFGEETFQAANEYFHQAIAIDPDYALALSGLGSLSVFRFIAKTNPDDLQAGIDQLQRAIALDPDLAEPYQWLTYAYTRAHRLEEAERAGERAVELDRGNSLAHYFLAVARQIRGEDERRWELWPLAAQDYLRALELEPGYVPAYGGLGWLYMINGQYEPARRVLDHAITVETEGKATGVVIVGGPRILRGMLHLREGELDAAATLLREVDSVLHTTDHLYTKAFRALIQCGLGETAYRQGACDVAVEHFTRAQEVAEQHPSRIGMGYLYVRAQLGLAKAFHQLGARGEASKQFALATAVFPNRTRFDFSWMWEGSEPQAYFDLASCLAARGEREHALSNLREAVAAGWGDHGALAADPGFDALRSDPQLRNILERARAREPLPIAPVAAG